MGVCMYCVITTPTLFFFVFFPLTLPSGGGHDRRRTGDDRIGEERRGEERRRDDRTGQSEEIYIYILN